MAVPETRLALAETAPPAKRPRWELEPLPRNGPETLASTVVPSRPEQRAPRDPAPSEWECPTCELIVSASKLECPRCNTQKPAELAAIVQEPAPPQVMDG